MEIKNIEKCNISNLVEVHKDSFNGFFLTELGDDFLMTYYNSLRTDSKAVLLGIFDGDNLLGFCAATSLSKGYNSCLVKSNFLTYLIVGTRILFSKPAAILRLVRNFSKSNSTIEDNGEYAELLSIGVSSNMQGFGIGKKLLLELEVELSKKGCVDLSLTTDFYNNENAIKFYESLGYEIYYDFIAYPNRKMYRMIKKIN